jgi:hypothetical protein
VLKEIPPEEIKAAIGKKVRVLAFGIIYEGTLNKFDEATARLHIKSGHDEVLVDWVRIEGFTLI